MTKKIISTSLTLIITICLIAVLNIQLSLSGNKTPRLGYFLSPFVGFWQNAEPYSLKKNNSISLDEQYINSKIQIAFDINLIPHIVAETDTDAYFAQGYITAKYRLWQMDFLSRIAGGRLSEVIGRNGIGADRYLRRLGLLYAAENSLKQLSQSPEMIRIMNAYCNGVNTYISQLHENNMPLEFKLLNYRPTAWTPLRSELIMQLMAFNLSGGNLTFDAENTKDVLGFNDLISLFPDIDKNPMDPIIPPQTKFAPPSIVPITPKDVATHYFNQQNNDSMVVGFQPPVETNLANGSNNWAVSGNKTASGKPILCNDPHLAINAPEIFYQIQITTPYQNIYGASIPGIIGVLIGFNDSIAFGLTNGTRRQKFYYRLKVKDNQSLAYWYNNQWKQPSSIRDEIICIRGEEPDTERVAVTDFGLLTYTPQYPIDNFKNQFIATYWIAYLQNDALSAIYKFNHAKNYQEFLHSIDSFKCPAQNFVYADKNNNIAIKQQGLFPALWQRQGDYIMPGLDSSYALQGFIPAVENPSIENPNRGFVSSANQIAADSNYPYWEGYWGFFAYQWYQYRHVVINQFLSTHNNLTIEDMMRLQNNTFDMASTTLLPTLISYLSTESLSANQQTYFDMLKKWDGNASVLSTGETVFSVFYQRLSDMLFNNMSKQYNRGMLEANPKFVLSLIKNDSLYLLLQAYNNDIKQMPIRDVIFKAFLKAEPILDDAKMEGKLAWGVFKNIYAEHLLGIPALSTQLVAGGCERSVDALTSNGSSNSGPSFRLVVELSTPIKAYTIMPGGESGNAGSFYYNNFIQDYAQGKYRTVSFITKTNNIINNTTIFPWHIYMTPSTHHL